ncbi:MAG: hypothetical protein QI223_06560 [Candidatus Korarchaeota archaeon]|nr:hypothetical protein [Candidatus Korarchaeota archaeon]
MDSVDDVVDRLAGIVRSSLDDPSKVFSLIKSMEKHETLSRLVFAIRHPLLYGSKFLGLLYVLMQFLLSALFLVTGLLLVVPSSEEEFQEVMYQFLDLLTKANVSGLRFLAFLVGLALLVMCVNSLANAGEVMQGLGVTEEG